MSAGRRVDCACGKEQIQSMDRHHMCFCSCRKCAIDGGSAYLRLMGPTHWFHSVETQIAIQELREKDDG